MVVVLMMSGILTTLNLLKRKIFQNKIYHVTQITYSICSCDPSLLTLAFLRKSHHDLNCIIIWPGKPTFLRDDIGSSLIISDWH